MVSRPGRAANTRGVTDSDDDRRGLPLSALAGGALRRVSGWTVGLRGEQPFAVSSRCRHQLGDLSRGSLDADGCLVCPWHGARYDVGNGRMVQGPRGFLGYHGRTPRYGALVRAYSRFLPLRRRRTTVRDGRVELGGR